MAAFCHCSRLAQGVKTSDELVEMPLCGQPATKKFKFFSPHNVPGMEHYSLTMNETTEWLPTPASEGAATGTRPKWPSTPWQRRPCYTWRSCGEEQPAIALLCSFLVGAFLGGPTYQGHPGTSEDNFRSFQAGGAFISSCATYLQLVRVDVVLGQFMLQDGHVARARTVMGATACQQGF